MSLYLDPATGHQKAEDWFAEAHDFSVDRAEGIASQAVRVADRPSPYGSAYVVADASDTPGSGPVDRLSQTTLIGNTVVTVTLLEKGDPAQGGSTRADELMVGLVTTSEAITAEIARQLVSRVKG